MARKAYIGVNGKARNIANIHVGVNGKARKVIFGYVGDDNGKARLFWSMFRLIQNRLNLYGPARQKGLIMIKDCEMDVNAHSLLFFSSWLLWYHQKNAKIWELSNAGLRKPVFPPPYEGSIWYSFSYLYIPINRIYRASTEDIKIRIWCASDAQPRIALGWINNAGGMATNETYFNVTESIERYEIIWRNYNNPPDYIDYIVIGCSYRSADKYLQVQRIEITGGRTYWEKAYHDLGGIITAEFQQPVKFDDVKTFWYVSTCTYEGRSQYVSLNYRASSARPVYKIGFKVYRNDSYYYACTMVSEYPFSVYCDYDFPGADYPAPGGWSSRDAAEATFGETTFYYYSFSDETYVLDVPYDYDNPTNLCEDNLVYIEADDIAEQLNKQYAVACLVMDGQWTT